MESPVFGSPHGRTFSALVANPAPGATIEITVPARRIWRFLLVKADLVTDGTSTDRHMRLFYETDAIETAGTPAALSQAVSLTRSYHFGCYPPSADIIGIRIFSAMPGVLLSAGGKLKISPDNIQLGDQLQGVRYLVEEWLAGS